MKSCGTVLMLLLMVPVALAEKPDTREEIEKVHRDSKAYIAMLDNPQRDSEQQPDRVITTLGIKPGEKLADIGAGSGYFSFRFAGPVGRNGHIYAVDINPDLVLHMNREIRNRRLWNVTTVLSAPDDPLIPSETIDRFFICNTWHHIQERGKYASLMKAMLRKGGQVIILDYKKEKLPVGPPPEMKLAKEEVIRELEAAGFRLDREHTFLDYQYFLVFSLP